MTLKHKNPYFFKGFIIHLTGFEPVTFGSVDTLPDSIKNLLNKAFPNISLGGGHQKGHQSFLNNKLLEVNFAWPSLPMEVKALIVAIFEAAIQQGEAVRQQPKAA